MVFVSGKYEKCPKCQSDALETVSEHFDEQDKVYVGEQRCTCGCAMLYTRRDPKVKKPARASQTDGPKSKVHAAVAAPLSDQFVEEARTLRESLNRERDCAAHTPGPWKPVQGNNYDSNQWVIVADHGRDNEWLLAEIEGGRSEDTLDIEAANARLIAAAPDLLALVKTFLSAEHVEASRVSEARQIVARVEGRVSK